MITTTAPTATTSTATTPAATTSPRSTRRTAAVAAAALAGGAVLANLAFVALGSVFDYPDVLTRPATEFVTMFQQERGAVVAWFGVLALAAALLAPGAAALGRLGTGRWARWSVWAGVEAAVVQVIGLSRWFLLVPGWASTATDPTADPAVREQALDRIHLAHTVLGKGVGETLGYSLTAFWTALVIAGFPHLRGGRVSTVVGAASAVLIAAGVLVPLGVPGTDLANFVGYVLWSGWIVALAVRVVRHHRDARTARTDAPAAAKLAA